MKLRIVSLMKGTWLGIDVGSAKGKVCSFCLIESDGSGTCAVSFEQGPAAEPYPDTNTWQALIGRRAPPWQPAYLKEEIEAEIGEILERSELVERWFRRRKGRPSAVAIDAPVAFAVEGDRRLTERQSTETFKTPTRKDFEKQLGEKKVEYLRVNNFWKCVGFAVYQHLAAQVDHRLADASLEEIAARTCDRRLRRQRIRETFPSDIYKRANGVAGTLSPEARDVLQCLVDADWRSVGPKPGRLASQTLDRLHAIRKFLRLDLAAGTERICEMRKRNGTAGDLWDAFTCAFAACCEDHGGAELHGWTDCAPPSRKAKS